MRPWPASAISARRWPVELSGPFAASQRSPCSGGPITRGGRADTRTVTPSTVRVCGTADVRLPPPTAAAALVALALALVLPAAGAACAGAAAPGMGAAGMGAAGTGTDVCAGWLVGVGWPAGLDGSPG